MMNLQRHFLDWKIGPAVRVDGWGGNAVSCWIEFCRHCLLIELP